MLTASLYCNAFQGDNVRIAIGQQSSTSTNSRNRAARLRDALTNYGAFLAAARRSDPLPTLRDLACDWLRAEQVEIFVPAGLEALSSDDPTRLSGPVLIGRRTVGRIEAQGSRPFDEDDRAILVALGHMVGAALEYAALQSQLDERTNEVQAHTETLEHLLAFGRDVVRGSRNPLHMAHQIASQVPSMVGGERASVLLLPIEELDDPMLVLSNGVEVSPERARQVAEHGLAGLALRERAPMLIDETDTDRRWLSLRLRHHDDRTRCAMAVPLLWGEQVIGALTVTTSHSRLFSPTQLELLELVACHVALALELTNLDTHLAAAAAGLGALATYLEAAVAAAEAGDAQALERMATVVTTRLREEQAALMSLITPS